MKHLKNLGVILFLLLSNSIKSQCIRAPFTESFNTLVKPSCISTSAKAGGPWEFDNFVWVVGCPRALDHSGNFGSYATVQHAGIDSSVVLEFDTIDVSSLANPYLSFYYYMCDVGYSPVNILAIETFNGTKWVGLDTIQEGSSGWKEYNYNLTAHTFGKNRLKIRFRAESGGAWNDFLGGQGLDDISIIELPTCLKPKSLSSNNITSTSAKVNWVEKDSAKQWQINYDQIGFIAGKGNNFVFVDTNTFATLKNLKPATEYAYYIRSICGIKDTSEWAVSTFLTDCPDAFTPPYNQSFDKMVPPLCWTEASGGTPITGPSNTTYSFWSHQDYLNTYNAGGSARLRMTFATNTDWIFSPPFDFSSSKNYSLFIDAGVTVHQGNTSENMGSDDTVKVLISIDSGKTWNSILDWHKNNQPSHQGEVYKIDLSSYSGVDNRFAIWASDGLINNIEDCNFFIGNFEILPPCDTPQIGIANGITATTAVLNWTETGEAGKWEVSYDTSGFTPGTARNNFIADNSSILIEQLRTETDYDFYVRSICRSADTSEWSEKASFRTLVCSPVSSPVLTDVRTVSADISWMETGDANQWEVQYDTLGFVAGNAGNSKIIDTDTFASLTALRASTDYDYYVRSICVAGDSSQWSSINSFKTEACFEADGLSVIPSSNLAELTWTENGNAIQWEIEYDTSGYNSGFGRFKKLVDSLPSDTIFNLRSDTDYDYYVRVICGLEDTSLYSPAFTFTTKSCESNTNLLASVSSNIAELSWTEHGTAIAWEIEYDTAGFILGNGNSKILLDTKTTLSSLRANSDYEWYVRAICGPGDTSNWSNKASFKTFAIVNECDYMLKLKDEGGNGWTGNKLAVKVGSVITNYTLNNGSEQLISIPVRLGDSIVLDYRKGGTFTTEVSYELFNADNERIYSSIINPPLGVSYTDTAKCPSCIIPSGLTTTNVSKDSAYVSWTESGLATKWILEWDFKGFEYGKARNNKVINTDTFTILTGLESLTEYDYNVRSICSIGDTSGRSLSGTFRSDFSCPKGAVCASYTAGDIDSDYEFNSLDVKSNCPESLTITIPAGNRIDSIFTIYDMTSTSSSFSWVSEQRSWLYSPTTQTGEDIIVSGIGNHSGTYVYERALNFANKFIGDVIIEMHAGRDLNFGPAGCRSDYVKVDNNTWNIAAYYSPSPSCIEPLQLKAEEIYAQEAKVKWLDLGAATQYEVEWDFKGFTPGSASNSMIVNTDTFTTISGLVEYSEYEFAVRTICGVADTSVWSEKENFTTKCGPFPSGIKVEPTDVTADVSWNKSENATKWIIEWDTSGLLAGLQRNSFVVDTDTFANINGLSKSTQYELYIRAICAPGDTSSRSVLESFTTLSCAGVSNLSATGITYDTANLGWVENGTATSWEISYDSANYILGYGNKAITNDNPHTVVALMPEKNYDFHVRAICGAGDTSLWSYRQTFTTASPYYYPIGEINSEDTNGVSDSIGLYIKTSGIVMGIDLNGGLGYKFTIIDLSSGIQEGIAVVSDEDINNYQVTQGDSVLLGGVVNQLNGLTIIDNTYKIEVLATNVKEPKPIIVSEPSEQTESKWIQIDSTKVIVGGSSLGNTNMTFSKYGTQFTVRVDGETDVDNNLVISPIARGDSICSIVGIGGQYDDSNPFTDGYELLPPRYQGISRSCIIVNLSEELSNERYFKLYPNPTNGQFTLRTSGFRNELIQVIIRDLSGRIVLREKINNANNEFQMAFNIEGNSNGIYFISLIDGEEILNQKIVLH